MARELTTLAVEKCKPGPKRREIPDGRVGGLYFVVQPTGKRSWALRYRGADRKGHKFTVGPYPSVSLSMARARAVAVKTQVEQGRDPCAEKKASRAAATVPAGDLIEAVTARFIEHHARRKLKPGTAAEVERILTREIVGQWRGRRLSQIGRGDIHSLLDGIVERGSPVAANRALSWLRKLCSWAIERGLIEASPCGGIRAPAVETPRDRILTDAELRAVWQAADSLEPAYAGAIKLLILTGARRSEVAGMTLREVDLDAKLWTLPRERVKNGRQHTVPLSDLAAKILDPLPRSEFVFTKNGRNPISGFARIKQRIDGAMPKGTPPWTLHDLRRSFASGCARLGVAIHVVEKCLNHSSGTFRGIVAVYQKHDFASEQRAAVETWARHVQAIVSGEGPANVIELKRGA